MMPGEGHLLPPASPSASKAYRTSYAYLTKLSDYRMIALVTQESRAVWFHGNMGRLALFCVPDS